MRYSLLVRYQFAPALPLRVMCLPEKHRGARGKARGPAWRWSSSSCGWWCPWPPRTRPPTTPSTRRRCHWPPLATLCVLYWPKAAPRCRVGGATIGWSVVDAEMQWGGTAEGGIFGGIWPSADSFVDVVKSDNTLTATTMLKVTCNLYDLRSVGFVEDINAFIL